METTQQPQAPKARTASQRLDDLEKGLMGIYQGADGIARDTTTLKEAVKLLGNKLDAIVKVINAAGTLDDDSIAKVMVQNNVDELKGRVDNLVTAGNLVLTAEPIDEKTFVVGREVNDQGEIVNPRLQFVVNGLQKELQPKLVGRTAGDLVEFQEGKLKFEILETYTIVTNPGATAAAESTTETPVPVTTEEAPAVTQSSTDATTDTAGDSTTPQAN
jgi:hypothetical protein